MADNKKILGPRDKKTISKQKHEVAYWTKKWGISWQQLVGAKRAVSSTSVKKIEKYLKNKNKI